MFKEALDFIGQENIIETQKIPQAGSDRLYTRIITKNDKFILCESNNLNENKSFIYFTEQFYGLKLPVSPILAKSSLGNSYLLQDLGKQSLLDKLLEDGHTNTIYAYYSAALQQLARLQIEGDRIIDYANCFHSKRFDDQAVLADLNYFKNYFLASQTIDYDKQKLQNEFEQLAHELNACRYTFFMYRDFQSRNIMIHEKQIGFIDFQGGMKGPIQYDVASLLWQAKAKLPEIWKQDLYTLYKSEVKKLIQIQEDIFDKEYNNLVLIRLLQVLGAYGLRGLIEKKPHFISSIPQGLQNLSSWYNQQIEFSYPCLQNIIKALIHPSIILKYQHFKHD
ncbi:MAG: phosphotransferase [Chitinophagaceae bacterium]